MLRSMVDEFGRKEVLDVGYRVLEPKGEFPKDLVQKISQMGLMGISFPEEYGGLGMSTVATSVVGERLAFYWPSLQLIWSANVSLAGYPIMTFGTEEQKKRLLPRLATGEILGCYALTEPGAGSDAANIQARATSQPALGNRWLLEGAKTFITNANNASVCVVFARVKGRKSRKDTKRHAGITAFLVESNAPCLRLPPEMGSIQVNKLEKWGLVCSHFCEFTLDCYLEEGAVLGEVGNGFHIAMETLNNGRINIAAQAVGIARRALYEAVNYARNREAFGKKLIEHPVRFSALADLRAKVDAAWQMALYASYMKDAGEDYKYAASEAKLFATETALECSLECLRVFGGPGYTLETIPMRIHHDALATIIYEGASDIQKMVIGKRFAGPENFAVDSGGDYRSPARS